MLEVGANPNYETEGFFSSSLAYAIYIGSIDMCRLLVKYGADTDNIDTINTKSSLLCALLRCTIVDDIITFLFSIGFEGWTDCDLELESVISYAIKYCSLENVALLIGHGVLAKIPSQDRSKILLKIRNPLIILLRVQHGHDVNA